jgi:putative chitinase
MFTIEQLRRIMPGLSLARATAFLPFLQNAVEEFSIATPARTAAFLAQLAHESGQFRFMEEIWGPTPAQVRYEPQGTLASRLGNTDAGDGRRFKGRGPIQVTGRANYRRYGDLLGIDLIADPPRAADPSVAFRVAALFWSRNGLNELADQATPDAFRQITRRINGGFNGLADRQQFFARACEVLGVTATRGVPRSLPRTREDLDAFGRGAEAIRPFARRLIARQPTSTAAVGREAAPGPRAASASATRASAGPAPAKQRAAARAGAAPVVTRAARKK